MNGQSRRLRAGYRRRRAGLLLVLAALLVAVILPRSQPRPIAGRPTTAPVPAPPAIGDCAQPPAGGWNAGLPIAGDPNYLPVATGPCADRRSGEVIAVLPASQVARPPRAAGPGELAAPDANVARCATELNGYLGLAAAGSPAAQTAWQPLPTMSTAVAGPSLRQRVVGQHWLSCIAYVTGVGGQGVTYEKSLRAGYTTGRLPRSAAQCMLTADPQAAARVPCSTPHQAELFGYGWSATPVTALQPTCQQLVKHLTGMADPTVGGALTVETAQQRVQLYSAGLAGTSVQPTGETSIPLCLVAVSAHHALAGPLIDLGTGPMPWS